MPSRPPALVLTPTPPAPTLRAFFDERFGAGIVFGDLPGLRRHGLLGTLRSLRDTHAPFVVVSGGRDELLLLQDYLVLLAFLVPGARRSRQLAGGEATALGPLDSVRSLVRILRGLCGGAVDLLRAWLRQRSLGSAAYVRHPVRGLSECLYLKPLLALGASVGGSVAHVAGVANALQRAGIRVRMLSMNTQPLVDTSVEQTVVAPGFLMAFPFEVNQYRYQSVFARAALGVARATPPDFIYQRYALNDLAGLVLRAQLGVPLVLEFNGSEVWAQRHWGEPLRLERLAQAIERVNLRHADLVVVVSQALVEQAISLGAARERVLFYPNGIDPLVFDPARFGEDDRSALRRELAVPAKATLLTFVGTFGRWHGTDVLAAAIRTLVDRQRGWLERHGVHFLFVGDGSLAPRVRSILGPDLASPFVTLAGLRPQELTPRVLAASDILLSPHVPNPDGTPFFGSPTKLFEYMAMGKPIVASDLDQIGWVLRGWRPGEPAPSCNERVSRAALLVEPGSAESLVAGIQRSVELPRQERDALGREARRLALESFTWDKNVEAVLSRLRASTASGPSGSEREA